MIPTLLFDPATRDTDVLNLKAPDETAYIYALLEAEKDTLDGIIPQRPKRVCQ